MRVFHEESRLVKCDRLIAAFVGALVPIMCVSCSGKPSSKPAAPSVQEQRRPDDAATLTKLEGLGAEIETDAKGSAVTVRLTGPEVSDESLTGISKLPYLKTLDLTRAGINGEGLANLSGLERLETLSLMQTGIHDEAMEHLAGLPALKRLNLTKCVSITDAGLKSLEPCTTLVQLDLRDCNLVTDVGLASIGKMVNLRDLKLYGPGITDTGMSHLAKLTKLKTLGLSDCSSITDAGMVHLKNLSLAELYLFRTTIGDVGLKSIRGHRGMRRLRLRDTLISNDGLEVLSGMTQLEIIDLSECFPLSDVGMAHLAGLTSLVDVNLWSTKVGDGGVAQLATLPKLKSLNLDATIVTDAAMADVVKLADLEFLHLGGTEVTDAGIEQLSSLKNLKTLIVTKCLGVSKKGVEGLAAAIPGIDIQSDF